LQGRGPAGSGVSRFLQGLKLKFGSDVKRDGPEPVPFQSGERRSAV
jgi:hypothetical protein